MLCWAKKKKDTPTNGAYVSCDSSEASVTDLKKERRAPPSTCSTVPSTRRDTNETEARASFCRRSTGHSLTSEIRGALGRELEAEEDFIHGATVGTGTFGRVKVVKFKNFKDRPPMALKMVKKSEILRLRQAVNINNEKNILLQISHPFIVDLLTTFQDKTRVYLLMEYVNGGELFTYLRGKTRFNEQCILLVSP